MVCPPTLKSIHMRYEICRCVKSFLEVQHLTIRKFWRTWSTYKLRIEELCRKKSILIKRQCISWICKIIPPSPVSATLTWIYVKLGNSQLKLVIITPYSLNSYSDFSFFIHISFIISYTIMNYIMHLIQPVILIKFLLTVFLHYVANALALDQSAAFDIFTKLNLFSSIQWKCWSRCLSTETRDIYTCFL